MNRFRIMRGFRRRVGSLLGRPHDPVATSIASLGIFDAERYLRLYPDVAALRVDPLAHYASLGAVEGRSPCGFFDTLYYVERNPDVAKSGLNPFLHYCEWGWRESRNPSSEFDSDAYASRHMGSLDGTVCPLVHYLTAGRAAGLDIEAVSDPDYALIDASGIFDPEWYLAEYPDLADMGVDPIAHYLKYGAVEGRNPSAFFDGAYYLRHNADIAVQGLNPLLHFCRVGWKELRNPGRDFDVWWYWSRHLDPASEDVNPLGHFQRHGRHAGLDARPPRQVAQTVGSGYRHLSEHPVRRICLFAGYDADGIVDDYVVDYLRQLSAHADIHYLADCDMQPGELEKIAPFTASASAGRHGAYDFGSYARLAKDIVGWDAIELYDELLLANDSCYLLRGLDDVFTRMDAKACDWWGLQATKGIAATRRVPRNKFPHPIPIATVRSSLLGDFESDYTYDFLVGSYFVAFRRPVIVDGGFRRLLDSVAPQASKKNVILKYEVGLTRYLIASGFAFDIFMELLYPFHPIFTNWYFRMVRDGFPLLKRYFLSENHYKVPRLSTWRERILRSVPGANVAMIERNLDRTVDHDKLWDNLHLGSSRTTDDAPVPAELLGDEAFLAADQSSPKYAHWWAFPTCAFTAMFSGNERAVFEQVKDDPEIRKIVFTRTHDISVDGVDVEVVPLESPRGQHLLMRCGNVFIKHSPTRNVVYPLSPDLHNLINLWHGIPYKRIGYASLDTQGNLQAVAIENAKCRAVISSSKVDSMAMASAFYPLSINDVWLTGLPRNDFILRDFDALPTELRNEEQALRGMLEGRRLLLFMPTFRNEQEDGYYRFSNVEVEWLRDWLERNNVVLGVREHMANSARTYASALARLAPLDLSDAGFPNVEILYRCSSALMTDYSSCFIDYMLTGKPAVSFAYDYDSYSSIERGSFYDLDFVFPGPVCRSFADLATALDDLFSPVTPETAAVLDWKRRLFFDHVDDCSAARVVSHVNELSDFNEVGQHLLWKSEP